MFLFKPLQEKWDVVLKLINIEEETVKFQNMAGFVRRLKTLFESRGFTWELSDDWTILDTILRITLRRATTSENLADLRYFEAGIPHLQNFL